MHDCNYHSLKRDDALTPQFLSLVRTAFLSVFVTVVLGVSGCVAPITNPDSDAAATTALRGAVWQATTLAFDGPLLAEQKSTFTDYRLDVVFSHGSGKVMSVPGYFAASGGAADDSASQGTVWHTKFVPTLAGEWRYAVRFRRGANLAMQPSVDGTSAGYFDGTTGVLYAQGADLDPTAQDFRKRGMLQDVKGRYLQYAGTGQHFLKFGAGSPENIFGYAGFDGTYDAGGVNFPALGDDQLHAFAPHEQDWREGDPVWGADKRGKSLIGVVNYLADVGVNAQYMVMMSVGGDGQDVFPWVRHDNHYVYDVSKLAQWERVLSYMDTRSILKDFLFSEMENESFFEGQEGGAFADGRKLFYREMVARFGHLLGLVWNLGEENGSDSAMMTKLIGPEALAAFGMNDTFVIRGNPAWIKATTPEQRLAFTAYIAALDPYGHAIVSHNVPGAEEQTFSAKLGDTNFSGISLQAHEDYNKVIVEWLDRSQAAGRQWMVTVDEPMGWEFGVLSDAEDSQHTKALQEVLWPSLLAGAAGVDWYFGWQNNAPTSDLSNEDMRSRHNLWVRSAKVRAFWEEQVPFWKMRGERLQRDGKTVMRFVSETDESLSITLDENGLSFAGFGEVDATQLGF